MENWYPCFEVEKHDYTIPCLILKYYMLSETEAFREMLFDYEINTLSLDLISLQAELES